MSRGGRWSCNIYRGEEANRKFSAVKKAIDEWDPYGLLPFAPKDEYDSESSMVAGRITDFENVMEMAGIVSDVFSKQFEKEKFAVNSLHRTSKNGQ
ncbi:MAG: YugE family protein [Oscillospiraceae bacterium]|nr:YugE family protein [Oscillospiraceae bacterium]